MTHNKPKQQGRQNMLSLCTILFLFAWNFLWLGPEYGKWAVEDLPVPRNHVPPLDQAMLSRIDQTMDAYALYIAGNG
jgi:hypothetical protein